MDRVTAKEKKITYDLITTRKYMYLGLREGGEFMSLANRQGGPAISRFV